MFTSRLPHRLLIVPFALTFGATAPAAAQTSEAAMTAKAELKDAKGQAIGRAELVDTTKGVLIHLTLTNAPAGVHAFHIHQTGRCEPPAFDTAGGHFNPRTMQHGLKNPKGSHAGDLPNVHVPAGGSLDIEVLAEGVKLAGGDGAVLDADGAALMLHASPDDYRTDPAGAAGARIACGVIMK
jgi:Cu-Zn family superoxide dismutase